jgi:hypothetical protein
MDAIRIKSVSSLEKILPFQDFDDITQTDVFYALKKERINVQFVISAQNDSRRDNSVVVSVSGARENYSLRLVRNVIADLPCYPDDRSPGTPLFIGSENNVYPDILVELDSGNRLNLLPGNNTVWFEYTPAENGTEIINFSVDCGSLHASKNIIVNVTDAVLPESDLIFTEWFHCDCLATYYNVPVFSERHWEIIENYLSTAARNGINCILTPVFTPPLDTEQGSYRPAVQLVTVKKSEDGYAFSFERLERWINLCQSIGIRFFEISHLFTQWGAKYAPQVVAETEKGTERIFGWDTPGTEGEYPVFLSRFLPELVGFLKKKGIIDRCRFHISDEPSGDEAIENYARARKIVDPYLKGCRIIDALSDVRFFRTGAADIPVPPVNHIGPFLDEEINERWTYYCCGQFDRVSNRFIAYPSFRNRIIGIQLYKFNIKGFLQWGYNFYYSMGSRRLVNPFTCQSGDGKVPSGDAFSVYPSHDGTAIESVRLAVFYEAIQDYAALRLCERMIGRENVVKVIDDTAGMNVTFTDYPPSAGYILELREKIDRLIENNGNNNRN